MELLIGHGPQDKALKYVSISNIKLHPVFLIQDGSNSFPSCVLILLCDLYVFIGAFDVQTGHHQSSLSNQLRGRPVLSCIR